MLLDESLPRALGVGGALGGYEGSTVAAMGWAGFNNGKLLSRAVAAGFRALVTADRNMEYQQNIAAAGIGLMVLCLRSNRVNDVLVLAPEVARALESLGSGEAMHIGAR